MLYKPKFCCNCGEKIERVDWGLWASRRFCDVCEIEHKGHEMLPRAIVGLACVFGIFGVGSFFRGNTPGADGSRQNALFVSESRKNTAPEFRPRNPASPSGVYNLDVGKNELNVPIPPPVGNPAGTASKGQPKLRNSASDEPAYFCGAMTKKGKPCTRRVKSPNNRCWQHAGQPSAAPIRKAPDFF